MRRYEQLQEALASRAVELVALSKEPPAVAARQRARDGLSFELLSDPELSVIRLYGVEHHKAVEFSLGALRIGGMPLSIVPQVRAMAIPTSILIDPTGVVRWVDQADDYRLRSKEERVLQAIDQAQSAKSESIDSGAVRSQA